MEAIKIEQWNGKNIRFLFIEGEWLAVAKDVAMALGYKRTTDAINLHCDEAVFYHPI